MKKKFSEQSAFFNSRVAISFTLCLIALVMAVGASRSSQQNQTPKRTAVFQGRLTNQLRSAPFATITQIPETGVIDMAALGIHPLPVPLPPHTPHPNGSAVGNVAVMTMSPEIGMASTTRAFSTVAGNFIP